MIQSPSPFMTVQECAAYIRVSEKTLYRWANTAVIPSRKHGGKVLFHKDEIDRWSAGRQCSPKVTSISRFQSARNRLGSLTTEFTNTRPLHREEGAG